MTPASHVFEEHVGEVRIRLEAESVPELFAEAARAFAELVCGEAPSAAGPPEPVALTAGDRVGLLVALLDELVFRAEVDGAVYPQLDVVRLGARELEATLRRAPSARPMLHVKAATFHDLTIREAGGRVTATVILDV